MAFKDLFPNFYEPYNLLEMPEAGVGKTQCHEKIEEGIF